MVPNRSLVPLVVRVRDQRHRAGDQLGPRRLDVHRRPVGPVVGDAVVVAGVVAGLQLGLRHRRLERHVPQGRRVGEVRLAAREVAQERHLADLLGLRARWSCSARPSRPTARACARAPRRASRPPRPAARRARRSWAGRPAPGASGRASRAGVKSGSYGQRRVAAHAEVVLHPALGRQAVVVPAHRVEDRLAAHPLEARDQVGVGVGVDVPDVQRPGHRRRRGVDRVDLVARAGAVERVGLVGLPPLRPLRLETLQRRLVRYDDGTPLGARRGPGPGAGV